MEGADVLRGNLSAAQYEQVVLGLIFLKYISDSFEKKYHELAADPLADVEDKDEYTADKAFLFFFRRFARQARVPSTGVLIMEEEGSKMMRLCV